LKHPNEIEKVFKQGAKRARAKAQETMQIVRKKIGF